MNVKHYRDIKIRVMDFEEVQKKYPDTFKGGIDRGAALFGCYLFK